jgi:hypothetical protein
MKMKCTENSNFNGKFSFTKNMSAYDKVLSITFRFKDETRDLEIKDLTYRLITALVYVEVIFDKHDVCLKLDRHMQGSNFQQSETIEIEGILRIHDEHILIESEDMNYVLYPKIPEAFAVAIEHPS